MDLIYIKVVEMLGQLKNIRKLQARAREIMKMKDEEKAGSEWYEMALFLHEHVDHLRLLYPHLNTQIKDFDFFLAMAEEPDLVVFSFAATMFEEVDKNGN